MQRAMSERSDRGAEARRAAVTRLTRLGEAGAQTIEVEGLAREYRLDFFRLGVAVVGLTAYLGIPAALVVWFVSGLFQIIAERVQTTPY